MPTKKAPPVVPDWQSELSEELDRADQRRRAAWSIMLTAADGDELSREQLEFLRAVGIDDSTRRREIHKMSRVLSAYRKCGTRAQREAAAAELAEVEEQLVGEIKRLEDHRDRLAAEAVNARELLSTKRAKVAQQTAAAAELTSDSVLPQWVLGSLSDLEKLMSSSEAACELREIEARLKLIESVPKISDQDAQLHHAHAVKLNGGPVLTTDQGADGKMIRLRINPVAWSAYLVSLSNEKPGLEARAAELNQELDLFRREAADLRGFWLSSEIEEQLQNLEVLP
jgi:hypothetical protein